MTQRTFCALAGQNCHMHIHARVLSCLKLVAVAALFLARTSALAQTADASNYQTDFGTVAKLSHDVCSVLDTKIRRTLYPQPLLIDKMAQPYLQPVEYFDGTNKYRLVALSEGSVELINGFAHARAVNNLEPGFLNQYLSLMASHEELTRCPAFQSGPREKVWGFDTMNFQMSQFNQIAGGLMAINFAHHYLGHYQKYAARLTDFQNHPVPICCVVTPGEWRNAVIKGANAAKQCGLGLDGLKAFYDSLGQLSTRPAWTLNFLPKDANVAKIKRDLDRIDSNFFLSEK